MHLMLLKARLRTEISSWRSSGRTWINCICWRHANFQSMVSRPAYILLVQKRLESQFDLISIAAPVLENIIHNLLCAPYTATKNFFAVLTSLWAPWRNQALEEPALLDVKLWETYICYKSLISVQSLVHYSNYMFSLVIHDQNAFSYSWTRLSYLVYHFPLRQDQASLMF